MMNFQVDDIGFDGLTLKQDSNAFCYGTDAILLAYVAGRGNIRYAFGAKNIDIRNKKKEGEYAVDLGTGNGVIPLILSRKTDIKKIVGVDVQKASIELARENIERNRLSDRIDIIESDVRILERFKDLRGKTGLVTCNPPYKADGAGLKSGNSARDIARHEILGSLQDFIICSGFLLKEKGDFFLINRSERLVDVIEFCRRESLEPKELQFFSGHEGEPPNLFIVHCVKRGNKELKIMPVVNIRDDEGNYTDIIKRAYD